MSITGNRRRMGPWEERKKNKGRTRGEGEVRVRGGGRRATLTYADRGIRRALALWASRDPPAHVACNIERRMHESCRRRERVERKGKDGEVRGSGDVRKV